MQKVVIFFKTYNENQKGQNYPLEVGIIQMWQYSLSNDIRKRKFSLLGG